LPTILRFRVEKLIRDKLPQIMREAGLEVFERVLEPEAFARSLKQKLMEEAAEAAAASSPEDLAAELADVLEVVYALAAANGLAVEDLEAERGRKREARGGFDARIYNAAVAGEEGCPALAYYLERPDQYPRI
jgi:predicted house-cleaning noncanonical NTP pyrophosphatase (MazG superfamily)